jgi:hypothetical protein
MKLYLPCSPLLLLVGGFCWYHVPHITWNESVLINNMPTFADDFTAVEHRNMCNEFGTTPGRRT